MARSWVSSCCSERVSLGVCREVFFVIPCHFRCCCESSVDGTDAHSFRLRKDVQNISCCD